MHQTWTIFILLVVYFHQVIVADSPFSYSVGNETGESNDIGFDIHLLDDHTPNINSESEEISNTIGKPPSISVNDTETAVIANEVGSISEESESNGNDTNEISESSQEEPSGSVEPSDENSSDEDSSDEDSSDEDSSDEDSSDEDSSDEDSSDEEPSSVEDNWHGSGSGSDSGDDLVDLESGEDLEDFSGSGSGNRPEISPIDSFEFESSEESYENPYGPLKTMCTHTDTQRKSWWQVDLEESRVVVGINIFNRAQGFHDQLTNAYIGVGNSSMSVFAHSAPEISEQCHMIKSALPPGLTKISCETPIIGRYVIIQLMAHGALVLCEVQVLEFETYHNGSIIPKEENVALNKPATQSGISWNGKPDNAVDGIIAAQYFAGMESMNCMLNEDEGNRVLNNIQNGQLYGNCAELHAAGHTKSGIYYIAPKIENRTVEPFQVHCDMYNEGGGWTTILNRHFFLAHQENFLNRPASDYFEGFGDLCLEYWLGTEKLHLLTQEETTLIVDITDSYSEVAYTEHYSSFKVDTQENNYTIFAESFNRSHESENVACLVSGTPFTVQSGLGGWWRTPEQLSQNYVGPNGKLWSGQNVANPIEWCNYSQHFSKSRKNFYIQFFQMAIRPASYKPRQ